MELTSQKDMVFFCAESRIAVWSVSHRLGSFRRFGVFAIDVDWPSGIFPFLVLFVTASAAAR